MDIKVTTYTEQSELWNGIAGRAWVAEQSLLDTMFKPLEEVLTEAIWTVGPKALLDVGCGTGAVTLAAARLRGERGTCTGVDVSEPMIEAARERALAEGVAAQFILANAEDHHFEPATYDMIVSRFGVMFFDDPVKAFGNLRRASSHEAQLRVVVFRGADENPFMTVAETAAAPLLPSVPRRGGGPGQFAFADATQVHAILADSGWTGIDLKPVDAICRFPATDLQRYFTRLGPLGRALGAVGERERRALIERVHAAFQSYLVEDEVRFTAACWMISARAGHYPCRAPVRELAPLRPDFPIDAS
jgi:SAM-dependent methyltransferase